MFRIVIAVAASALAAATLGVLAQARAATEGPTAVSGPFIGSYTAHLTAERAARRGDSRLAGRFTLVLRRNGTYSASNPLDGMTGGRLSALSGRRLRFSNDFACRAGGHERSRGGIYRWAITRRRLTLRLVSEGPCTGRTQTLTYPVWVRR
jgi:hypothetical protein